MEKASGLLFLFLMLFSPGEAGISACVQRAWSTRSNALIYSAGIMRPSGKSFQYYEGGILALPASRSSAAMNDTARYAREYLHSAYGLYGGYFVNLAPVFRPGMIFGTMIRDDAIYKSHDDRGFFLNSYSDFRLDYYAAFSIQAGMFSFIISNYGIGGGLNYLF